MGTTLSSVHIYTNTPIDDPVFGRSASFSEGWQTIPLDQNEEYAQYFARELSKKVPAPILAFHIFDGDEIVFYIYKDGKKCAVYGTYGHFQNKGIYQIPGLVGYPEGYKRRISEILTCTDIALLTGMLEEFFGVALLVDREMTEKCPERLHRSRGEALYLDFHKAEQKLRGKQAPIGAELIMENPGKLFDYRFFGPFGMACAHGYYFFGYDTPEAGGNLRSVRFRQGRLEPAEEKLVKGGARPDTDSRFEVDYGSRDKVVFRDGCPDAYIGQAFVLPIGFYPLDFDDKDRLILRDFRGGVAFMTSEGKVIAKIRVKGEACCFADGYLLTCGPQSFYAYEYDPREYVRIYRLEDR